MVEGPAGLSYVQIEAPSITPECQALHHAQVKGTSRDGFYAQ
jgi:hypothetical protein